MCMLHMVIGHFGRIVLFMLSALASAERMELDKLRIDLEATAVVGVLLVAVAAGGDKNLLYSYHIYYCCLFVTVFPSFCGTFPQAQVFVRLFVLLLRKVEIMKKLFYGCSVCLFIMKAWWSALAVIVVLFFTHRGFSFVCLFFGKANVVHYRIFFPFLSSCIFFYIFCFLIIKVEVIPQSSFVS